MRAPAQACREEITALQENRRRKEAQLRPGMQPNHCAQAFDRLQAALQPAWERLAREPEATDWWMVLRLYLPDAYGSPRLKASLTTGGETRTLLEGQYKPSLFVPETCFYTVQVPFSATEAPDGICIEAGRYGGQGVSFVELQSPTVTLLPQALRSVSGQVEHADAVLRDDARAAYLGNTDISAAILDPSLAETYGVLDIALKPW